MVAIQAIQNQISSSNPQVEKRSCSDRISKCFRSCIEWIVLLFTCCRPKPIALKGSSDAERISEVAKRFDVALRDQDQSKAVVELSRALAVGGNNSDLNTFSLMIKQIDELFASRVARAFSIKLYGSGAQVSSVPPHLQITVELSRDVEKRRLTLSQVLVEEASNYFYSNKIDQSMRSILENGDEAAVQKALKELKDLSSGSIQLAGRDAKQSKLQDVQQTILEVVERFKGLFSDRGIKFQIP